MPPEAVGIVGCSGRRVRSRRRPCPPCRRHAAGRHGPFSSGMSVISPGRQGRCVRRRSAGRSALPCRVMIPACIRSTYSFDSASNRTPAHGSLHLRPPRSPPAGVLDPPDQLLQRPPHDLDPVASSPQLQVVSAFAARVGPPRRPARSPLRLRPRRIEGILHAPSFLHPISVAAPTLITRRRRQTSPGGLQPRRSPGRPSSAPGSA
jgi:hypothetical protein